jgi:hypothetical protein
MFMFCIIFKFIAIYLIRIASSIPIQSHPVLNGPIKITTKQLLRTSLKSVTSSRLPSVGQGCFPIDSSSLFGHYPSGFFDETAANCRPQSTKTQLQNPSATDSVPSPISTPFSGAPTMVFLKTVPSSDFKAGASYFIPTTIPHYAPTSSPTGRPSGEPTNLINFDQPTGLPTYIPHSGYPSQQPLSLNGQTKPSGIPSAQPSAVVQVSDAPVVDFTGQPTVMPTMSFVCLTILQNITVASRRRLSTPLTNNTIAVLDVYLATVTSTLGIIPSQIDNINVEELGGNVIISYVITYAAASAPTTDSLSTQLGSNSIPMMMNSDLQVYGVTVIMQTLVVAAPSSHPTMSPSNFLGNISTSDASVDKQINLVLVFALLGAFGLSCCCFVFYLTCAHARPTYRHQATVYLSAPSA